MTVLDVLSRFRETEAVFKAWDRRAGAFICCRALFDSLQEIADRCRLDLIALTAERHAAAGQARHPFENQDRSP